MHDNRGSSFDTVTQVKCILVQKFNNICNPIEELIIRNCIQLVYINISFTMQINLKLGTRTNINQIQSKLQTIFRFALDIKNNHQHNVEKKSSQNT